MMEKDSSCENSRVTTPTITNITSPTDPTACTTGNTGSSTASGAPFGVFTSKKMSETFLRTLECPVCLEIVIPPVFSCTLGHIICSMCRPKLSKCGLCGSAFTTIRNYPIEAMLGLVETECRHNSCSMTLMADKMKEHLSVCEYRPIPCHEVTVMAECKGTLVNFEDYTRHLMEVHGKSYVDLTTEYPEFVVYDVSTTFHGSQLLGVMNYKGKTFFLRRDYVFPRHYAMCWVTVMAPEQEARKYTFHLKITDPKDHRKSMEWRIRAHSIQASVDMLKTSGDCAFIPYDALIPFCERKYIPTPNGQLWEYKWTMVGKVSEYDPPPPIVQPHSCAHMTSTNNPPSGGGAQVNPLNLCSSSTSSSSGGSAFGGSSTSGGTAPPSSSSSYNHLNSSFNYSGNPMGMGGNTLSYSISGNASSASGSSHHQPFRVIHPTQLRSSIPTALAFFPTSEISFPTSGMPGFGQPRY